MAETASAAGRTDVVHKVLSYGDAKLAGHAKWDQWALFAFRMRLAAAYRQGDLAALESLPLPPNAEKHRFHVNGHQSDPALDSRAFYRALLLLDEKPGEAREIFDELIRKMPGRASDAVNRFAASIGVARKLEDPDARQRAFQQALHEWTAIEPSIPGPSLVDVRTNVDYLRLAALDGAEQYDDFDAAWADLDGEERVNIDFVALAVEDADRRGFDDRAREILHLARPYHVGPDGSRSARFAALEDDRAGERAERTSRNQVVDEPGTRVATLRRSYLELRYARAEIAAAAVSENGAAALHEYLCENLIIVGLEFLKRGVLFADLADENKYNDVVVSLLKMRLDFLGWHVPDQPRGGESSSGKGPGERDWVLVDRFGERAVFEALRLNSVDTTYINEHVDRAMFRYNPGGAQQVYVIVYYYGANWRGFWATYVEHVRSTSMRGMLPARNGHWAPSLPAENLHVERFVYDATGTSLFVYHMGLNIPRA